MSDIIQDMESKKHIEELSYSEFISFLYSERERENSLSEFHGWNNWALVGAIITVICSGYAILKMNPSLDVVKVLYNASCLIAFFLTYHSWATILRRERAVDFTKVRMMKEVMPVVKLVFVYVCGIASSIAIAVLDGCTVVFWLWISVIAVYTITLIIALRNKEKVVPSFFREMKMVEAFRELFETCRKNMFHPGDLLLCQQNGTMFGKDPVIGFGEEGLNSLQQINALFYNGIGKMTGDDDYFKKNGDAFFHGTSELEMTIQTEMKAYQEIWENVYFLRILTEVARVANGERYDWQLDMYKLGNKKSSHIRDQIIKRLDVCPKFKRAMEIGFRRQIRNAVAHSQFHVIQGGIWFDNYKAVNKDEVQAIGFEEWEKIYCYSYFIFRGVFDHLSSIVQQLYMPATKITATGGITILCDFLDDNWGEVYIYPYQNGKTWRFNQPGVGTNR